MTKREILKIAKENNINMERIKIYKRDGLVHIEMADIPTELLKKNLESGDKYKNIPEVDRLIRRYNRQALRLIKILPIPFCGFKAGSGEWYYREGDFTWSEKLASVNMD